MANTFDKLDKLAEGDFLSVATISDYRCKEAAVYRVRTECNLGQY
jgi:hypothetical protein